MTQAALKSKSSVKRTRGPSQKVTDKVTHAALQLLMENGSAGLSFEMIAEQSGIHKTTLYRRWGSASELLKSVIASIDIAADLQADTGSLKDDLNAVARDFAAHLQRPEITAINRVIAGSRDIDGQLGQWMDDYWQSRYEIYKVIAAKAVTRGEEINPNKLGLAIEIIVGPLQLRILMTNQPVDDELINEVALAAYRVMATNIKI